MTRTIITAIGLLMIIGGCDFFLNKTKQIDPKAQLLDRIDKSVALITLPSDNAIHTNRNYRFDVVVPDVKRWTNRQERAEMLERYIRRFMALDLSVLPYDAQDSWLAIIDDFAWDEILECGFTWSTDADLDYIYDLRFEYLDWMRGQLYRMRPQVKHKYYSSYEESVRFRNWKQAYIGLYHDLRGHLCKLESPEWLIDEDLRYRPNARREDIIKKVETWLGHPLRSKEELLKFSRYESEEYKKVRSNKYAPVPAP